MPEADLLPKPAEIGVQPDKAKNAQAPTEPPPSEQAAAEITAAINTLTAPDADGDLNDALQKLALAITDKPHQESVSEEVPVIEETTIVEPDPNKPKPRGATVDADIVDDVRNEPEPQNLPPQEITVDPTLNEKPDAELRQLLNATTDPTLKQNILSVLRNRYPPIETPKGLDNSKFILSIIDKETINELLRQLNIKLPDDQNIDLGLLKPEDVQKLLDFVMLQATSAQDEKPKTTDTPDEATDVADEPVEEDKAHYETLLVDAVRDPRALIEQALQGDETAQRILVEIEQMRSKVISEIQNMQNMQNMTSNTNPSNQIQKTIQQLQDLDPAKIKSMLDNGAFKTPIEEIVAETIINKSYYINNAESYAPTIRSQASWRLAGGVDPKPNDDLQQSIDQLSRLSDDVLQQTRKLDNSDGQIAQAILQDRLVKKEHGQDVETPEAAQKRAAYEKMIMEALLNPYIIGEKAQAGDQLAEQVLTELKAIRESIRNNIPPDPLIQETKQRLEKLSTDELNIMLKNSTDISNLQDFIIAQEIIYSRRDIPDWLNRDAIPFLDDKERNPLGSPTTAARLYELSRPPATSIRPPNDNSDLFDDTDYAGITNPAAIEQELKNTKTGPESEEEKKEKMRLLNLLWWTLKAAALGAGLVIAGTAGASVGAVGPKNK